MNTQIQDIKKILRIITIILVGSTLLTPFVFYGDLFFPFITGKAFFMRFMIILSTISYTGLILIDNNSRPKKSPMLYALLGFMIVLILATLNSVNPTRSMWSNFERMEGLVTMLYMATLFIISASTLRKSEWSYFMNFSIIISFIVGIQAMSMATQSADRISGYLGNSSYLGVYALIHVFFGLLGASMIFRGNREKELMQIGEHAPAKKLNINDYLFIAMYLIVVIFNAYILFKTGTRGAFVGLVAGLILASVHLVWKEKNKIIRSIATGFLIIVIVSVSFLGIFKHSSMVQNSNQLSRFAGLATWDFKSVLKNQGEARTLIWSMAFDGFKEKPILGWGQDNFGSVFAKYYRPEMYGQEQWFDRSHDVFMDWLIAGGLLGLLGYLSLFVFALYFLFSKKAQFTIIERSVWLGLLVSYFIHNIFVFDNLSSYVLFFLIIAYINDRYTHDKNEKIEHKKISEEETNKIILIGVLVFILLSYITYQTILKPYTQNVELISALRISQEDVVTNRIDINKKYREILFDLGPTGRFEAFEQLSTNLPKIVSQENISTSTKDKLFSTYLDIVKQYDSELNQDARFNYFVSNTYRSLGILDQALIYADKTYKLSPQKQSFAYSYASVLLNKGDTQSALALLKKAYEDFPKNITAYGYYIGTLSDIAKADNYNPVKLGGIAQILADEYKKNGQDILLKKDFWNLFTNKDVKNILVNRLIELLPEEKDKILEASK